MSNKRFVLAFLVTITISLLSTREINYDDVRSIESKASEQNSIEASALNESQAQKQDEGKTIKVVYTNKLTSLTSRPIPEWYNEAKIGILVHWGLYSVPAVGVESYGSEWFWYKWIVDKHPSLEAFMGKIRAPGFTYQDFARDFTAEHFDPLEWVKLFEETGAKYVVLTSKHHDGFTLWPSKYSFSWNSVHVGPHRDIVGEFTNAMNNSALKLGLYYSLYEWFDPIYLQDKSKRFRTNSYVKTKMINQMKELIENYKPEVLWTDGHWQAKAQYWDSKNFLAWLYNNSPTKDTIVTNDRWGSDIKRKVGDFHTGVKFHFSPRIIQKKKFENCITLDKLSWGYRENVKLEEIMTVEEIIKDVVTTVSTNGNILINVAPTKSGIIHPIFVERLRDLGSWLKINGEAIYGSRPWITIKEHQNLWYTAKVAGDRIIVYAILLRLNLERKTISLKRISQFVDKKTAVTLLGCDVIIKFENIDDSLVITIPEEIDEKALKFAWTFKIDIPLPEPEPQTPEVVPDYPIQN